MSNFHVDLSINSIEEFFTWRDKKFLLRGAILGDGGHFTTVLRMPNGWMQFDDMARPKFKFCKKEEDRVAMGGKIITCVAFEIVPQNETRQFGNVEVDWTSTFVGRWATSHPHQANLLDDDEESIKVVSPTPIELTEQRNMGAQCPVHTDLFDTNEDSIEVLTTTTIESVEHSDRTQPMLASNMLEQLKKALQSKKTSSKKKI